MSDEAAQPQINIVGHFERRLGHLETEIVQRDIQIEQMALEIEGLRFQLKEASVMLDADGSSGSPS